MKQVKAGSREANNLRLRSKDYKFYITRRDCETVSGNIEGG